MTLKKHTGKKPEEFHATKQNNTWLNLHCQCDTRYVIAYFPSNYLTRTGHLHMSELLTFRLHVCWGWFLCDWCIFKQQGGLRRWRRSWTLQQCSHTCQQFTKATWCFKIFITSMETYTYLPICAPTFFSRFMVDLLLCLSYMWFISKKLAVIASLIN